MMVEPVDEDPGYIRMVGHEFVQRFNYDSFYSPGVAHKYYKDGSVMLHPEDGSIRRSCTIEEIKKKISPLRYDLENLEDGSIRSTRRRYTIKEIKKKISPLEYDMYSRVIPENREAYPYDSGIEAYVSRSLIGKDEFTQSCSQCFVFEKQNGKRRLVIVVNDKFQYTKDFNNPHGKNKGLVNDDEDVDEDGYMGSVNNSVIDTDEEQNFTMTIQPDLGDPQDGSVIDAEPKLPKSPYTVLPRGGEAPSSSLIPSGSGSKEVEWTLVRSKAHKVKKEELPGRQKRARDEGERRNQSQNMPRKENKTDHHGKTVKEARLDSKEVLRALSNSPSEKRLTLITGHCRRRNVGNRAPIRDNTEELLSTLPVQVKRVNDGGALEVTVPAEIELILSGDERRNKKLQLLDFWFPVLKKDSRGKK